MHDVSYSKAKYILIFMIVFAAILWAVFSPPIEQDPSYHQFVDVRTVWGITNFWNVISSFLFFIFGIAGLIFLIKRKLPGIINRLLIAYILFFSGTALIGIGSGFYHLNPSNVTLVWDRLPMSITFMSFFCIVIADHISINLSRWLLWPLLSIALISVLYWYIGELYGYGDLRLYALVQFLPMLILPVVLLLFSSNKVSKIWYWSVIIIYAASKIVEFYDEDIYRLFTGLISGHTIKHVLASLATLCFLFGLSVQKGTKN